MSLYQYQYISQCLCYHDLPSSTQLAEHREEIVIGGVRSVATTLLLNRMYVGPSQSVVRCECEAGEGEGDRGVRNVIISL